MVDLKTFVLVLITLVPNTTRVTPTHLFIYRLIRTTNELLMWSMFFSITRTFALLSFKRVI